MLVKLPHTYLRISEKSYLSTKAESTHISEKSNLSTKAFSTQISEKSYFQLINISLSRIHKNARVIFLLISTFTWMLNFLQNYIFIPVYPHWYVDAKIVFSKLNFLSCVHPLICKWKNIFIKIIFHTCAPPLM